MFHLIGYKLYLHSINHYFYSLLAGVISDHTWKIAFHIQCNFWGWYRVKLVQITSTGT